MIAQHKQTLEREIKLSIPRPFSLPPLPGEPLSQRCFTSTYYDTEDHRLAQSGMTLRYRVEQRTGAWQLKLPRGEARMELEFSGGPRFPPASITKLLFAHLRGHPLMQIAKLRTKRTGVRMAGDGGGLADVVVDSVVALDNGHVIRHLHELEVELIEGSESDLLKIEKLLREAGAQDGDHRPKVFQVLGLEMAGAGVSVPVTASSIEHLKAMLRAQIKLLLLHDPGTRLGTDPEDLHQARVATRRLRAYLRAAQPMLIPGWSEELRTEINWLGRALGLVRDLDVQLEYLDKETSTLRIPERRAFQHVLEALQLERSDARKALLEVLESDRYLALLDRIESAAQSPPAVDAAVPLSDIARDAFKNLRRAMRKAGPEADNKTLHRIRIKGKRARYAAELAEGVMGKPATRFIQQAKVFQDLLGEHQDAVVCEQRLRKLFRQLHGRLVVLSLGQLIERQRKRRQLLRAALPKVWSKLQKRGDKAWE